VVPNAGFPFSIAVKPLTRRAFLERKRLWHHKRRASWITAANSESCDFVLFKSGYKTIIGRSLRARTLPSQKTEARVACSVLNRKTRLGMPVSQRTV
jgi:hypothetical protein